MKRFLISIALIALPLFAAAANVGVSVNIGSPDYYGQLQLGNMPPPQLIYGSPIIIQQVPGVAYPPIYLRVPHQHHTHWRHFCREYNACNRPVYFVNDGWYRNTYVPRYRHDHPQFDHGRGYGYGRDHGRSHHRRDYDRHYYDRHDDRHDDRRDHRKHDNGRVHIQIDDHKKDKRHHDDRR